MATRVPLTVPVLVSDCMVRCANAGAAGTESEALKNSAKLNVLNTGTPT